MIRPITLSDLRELEGHQNGFPMPNVLNPLYFYQIAMIDQTNDEVIGLAFIKLTTEVSLIFKRGISQLKRAKAYLEMFAAAENALKECGLDDTHIFILGPDQEVEHYHEVIKKLGFVDAKGIPMYYRVGDREWLRELRKKRNVELKISEISPPSKHSQTSWEVQAEPLVPAD